MFFNNFTEISEAIYLAVTMVALGIAAMATLISVVFALFSIACAAWDFLSNGHQPPAHQRKFSASRM